MKIIAAVLLMACVALLFGCDKSDKITNLGNASTMEIWWRNTATRQNAAQTFLLRFRTQNGDWFLRHYPTAIRFDATNETKKLENIVTSAKDKQKTLGTKPILVLATSLFCYPNGTESGRQGYAYFYPDDQDQPSGEKYPVIFASGFTTNEEIKLGDVLMGSCQLNWQSKHILHYVIESGEAHGP